MNWFVVTLIHHEDHTWADFTQPTVVYDIELEDIDFGDKLLSSTSSSNGKYSNVFAEESYLAY